MSQRTRKPYDWKQQDELANIIDKMLRRAATRPGSLQHNLDHKTVCDARSSRSFRNQTIQRKVLQ